MYDPVLDKVYELFRKGMGYVHEKHIYKFKDYSECIFDTQIQSKWWLVGHLQNKEKRGGRDIRTFDILASWYGSKLDRSILVPAAIALATEAG